MCILGWVLLACYSAAFPNMLLPFILLVVVSKDAVSVTASAGKREGKLGKGTAHITPGSLGNCGVATSTLKWVGAGWG